MQTTLPEGFPRQNTLTINAAIHAHLCTMEMVRTMQPMHERMMTPISQLGNDFSSGAELYWGSTTPVVSYHLVSYHT